MERRTPGGVNAAHLRVGISLGAADSTVGACLAELTAAAGEFAFRLLSLLRLLIVIVPIAHHCCSLHSDSLPFWFARLCGVLACVAAVLLLTSPEQLFNGLALRQWRPAFERLYPQAKHWAGGGATDCKPPSPLQSSGGRASDGLGGTRVRLRIHNTERYLCLTAEGYVAAGSEAHAMTVALEHVGGKAEDKVPDTYTLRVEDGLSSWDGEWLSFSSVNQLRTGGWLGAYSGENNAGPYKVVVDSSCPRGTCKLVCAWPRLSPVTRRYCTGFYLAEQLSGSCTYIGHGQDRDAALLELLPVSQPAPAAGSCS